MADLAAVLSAVAKSTIKVKMAMAKTAFHPEAMQKIVFKGTAQILYGRRLIEDDDWEQELGLPGAEQPKKDLAPPESKAAKAVEKASAPQTPKASPKAAGPSTSAGGGPR